MRRACVVAAVVAASLCCDALFAADQYIFHTTPPLSGASVFVDDSLAGNTDEHGKLALTGIAPGVHQVRVENGGESYTAEVAFDAELNALPPFPVSEPDVRAAAPDVEYRVDTNVPEAEVTVDGASAAVTDSAGRATLRLTAGRTHVIEVRRHGFAAQRQTITPSAAGELAVTLQEQSAPPHGVDMLLVALVAVLGASIALLLTIVLRRRGRSDVPAQPQMQPAAGEGTGGHFDRYRLVAPLGNGGVATIYRACDLVEKSMVALKVLDGRWLTDHEMVRKFLAEGEALRAISQFDAAAPVVKCYRFGREHLSIVGRPFIALELLEGETLQNRLDRERALDAFLAAAVGWQIASALVAVHGAGIVHRDLTPDNIFLRKSNFPAVETTYAAPSLVLIDFGIARQELMSRATLDGSIAGKPHYMSPEQCRGLTVDARGDLYSLGIILYLMAAGQLPFAGRDPFEVMRAQMTEEPPRLPAAIDPVYAALCARLLQKAPEARPQSAASVALELKQILSSASGSASTNVVTFQSRRVS